MFGKTRETYTEVWIAGFDDIWHRCSLKKKKKKNTFLSAIVDVEGMKTTFKIGDLKPYFVKYLLKIIKDTVFV